MPKLELRDAKQMVHSTLSQVSGGLLSRKPGIDALKDLWQQTQRLPKGNVIFSFIVSKMIPYTGSIDPLVVEFSNDKTRVQLRDTKRVRNHLNSVHALALANVGEFCTGLKVAAALPTGQVFILVELKTQYLKKARGLLEAECTQVIDPLARGEEPRNIEVEATVKNTDGEVVSVTKAVWRLKSTL